MLSYFKVACFPWNKTKKWKSSNPKYTEQKNEWNRSKENHFKLIFNQHNTPFTFHVQITGRARLHVSVTYSRRFPSGYIVSSRNVFWLEYYRDNYSAMMKNYALKLDFIEDSRSQFFSLSIRNISVHAAHLFIFSKKTKYIVNIYHSDFGLTVSMDICLLGLQLRYKCECMIARTLAWWQVWAA